ncbi:metallophosphoesterase [Fulvivirga sp. 29W222]|uniref:Metallophosphoesterase n=1 Tax=Fulvivirga marina TaxID=2494733 RepID=A0A937KBY2_9BACT|nr:metallophosphoesterase [Fulvivirga marina]MBL6447541.1 metallophosphoesterase [Fulvivirga marina]
MKQFVVGDIHGAYKALIQCLERSSFDYENDQLVCLGDVCDGWPETNQAIEELLKIRNLVFILGNHDHWTLEWALGGNVNDIWLSQGGANTIKSYPGGMPDTHVNLLQNARYYYLNKNKLFVHAGIDPEVPLEVQGPSTFLWDRSLYRTAMARRINGDQKNITPYDEVFIGHTPIHKYNDRPIKSCEVWLMDTGAGWDGTLTLMNIETKEVFISDRVDKMYPPGSGRIK